MADDKPTVQEILDNEEVQESIRKNDLKVDNNVTVNIIVGELPSDVELSRSGEKLVTLGQRKGKTIMGRVKTAFALLTVFVVLTQVPEAVSKARRYVAKTYDFASELAKSAIENIEEARSDTDEPQYVFIPADWMDDEKTYQDYVQVWQEESRSSSSSSSSSAEIILTTSNTQAIPLSGVPFDVRDMLV